ncbi:MAG TPA: high-potential iron-sulfur protein [Woeseiaceae bacterium]|nr:high-potential iron-sulfur protein [Woeseiaceae bacterium]
MKDEFSPSRRRALRNSLVAVAGLAGLGALGVSPVTRVRAEDLPKVSEDDPTAQALAYTHDATTSARTDPNQFCNNCLYYKGTADDAWARCDLFPGKLVAGPGWCNAWTAKG